MPQTFGQDIDQAILCLQELKQEEGFRFLNEASKLLIQTFQNGGKIIVAGNGGSLCDATHFAEELTGIFHRHRPALPAIALADPGHLTCVGNDLGFEEVFARGVEAYGKKGDVFIALTTSGNSKNLVKAVERAKKLSLKTIAFLGRGGGRLKGQADLEWVVEAAPTTDRIQELHMTAIHLIIKEVEETLFGDSQREPISHAAPLALSL
jgi:D-sedoheptulose 7-phosphate isomerase